MENNSTENDSKIDDTENEGNRDPIVLTPLLISQEADKENQPEGKSSKEVLVKTPHETKKIKTYGKGILSVVSPYTIAKNPQGVQNIPLKEYNQITASNVYPGMDPISLSGKSGSFKPGPSLHQVTFNATNSNDYTLPPQKQPMAIVGASGTPMQFSAALTKKSAPTCSPICLDPRSVPIVGDGTAYYLYKTANGTNVLLRNEVGGGKEPLAKVLRINERWVPVSLGPTTTTITGKAIVQEANESTGKSQMLPPMKPPATKKVKNIEPKEPKKRGRKPKPRPEGQPVRKRKIVLETGKKSLNYSNPDYDDTFPDAIYETLLEDKPIPDHFYRKHFCLKELLDEPYHQELPSQGSCQREAVQQLTEPCFGILPDPNGIPLKLGGKGRIVQGFRYEPNDPITDAFHIIRDYLRYISTELFTWESNGVYTDHLRAPQPEPPSVLACGSAVIPVKIDLRHVCSELCKIELIGPYDMKASLWDILDEYIPMQNDLQKDVRTRVMEEVYVKLVNALKKYARGDADAKSFFIGNLAIKKLGGNETKSGNLGRNEDIAVPFPLTDDFFSNDLVGDMYTDE